jgi:large subunit ribosomal protein L4
VKLKLRNREGRIAGDVEVMDGVFGVPMNEALVQQVVVGQLANGRQGTAQSKSRSDVSGGGRKPFPQKGTGRARQGTSRAPHMRGGGTAFGPAPRSYRHETPRRMRRASMLALLSDKVRDGRVTVLEELSLESGKTGEMVRVLSALKAEMPVLLVADGADADTLRAARNIPKLSMLPAALLNSVDLLRHRGVVMTLDAVRKAEELWGAPLTRGSKAEAGR